MIGMTLGDQICLYLVIETITPFLPGKDSSIFEGLTTFRTLDGYLIIVNKQFLKHSKS